MTDQTQSNEQVSPERENAAVLLANEFLARATVGEALGQISLNALVQLAQNQALEQGKQNVEKMSDEEVEDFIASVKKRSEELAEATAEAAVEATEKTTA